VGRFHVGKDGFQYRAIFEDGIKPSGFIEGGELPEQLNRLFKFDLLSWRNVREMSSRKLFVLLLLGITVWASLYVR
jgi:hypothetical protein